MYKDRIEAGMGLVQMLQKYKGSDGLVLAVPRGGVPIAYVVSKGLDLPMEIIFSKKIGHPKNSEYAIGAVSLNGSVIEHKEDVPDYYIKQETARIRNNLVQMRKKFIGDKEPVSFKNKTVIVIDDGIATGNTLLGTIHILKKSKPSKIVLAVPVASQSAIDKLLPEVDEIVCPLVPEVFYGVGAFYEKFSQVTDEDVIYYIEKHRQEYMTL